MPSTVNIFGRSVYAVKKNKESLVVASKETELEVNADKRMYIDMSRDQNAGRSHNVKTDNSFFEKVGEFKYLGTTLTNHSFFFTMKLKAH
jgi:hypothetical protein